MLRSLVALAAMTGMALAQTAVGPSALGVYVDLDTNGNVVTVYVSPQDPVAHPTTEWLPINDARVQAFYLSNALRGPVPTGVKSQ